MITLATAIFPKNIQDAMRYREPLNIVQLSANAAVEVQQDILTIRLPTPSTQGINGDENSVCRCGCTR